METTEHSIHVPKWDPDLGPELVEHLKDFGVSTALVCIETSRAMVVVVGEGFTVSLSTDNQFHKGGETARAWVQIGPYQYIYEILFESVDGLVRSPNTKLDGLIEDELAKFVANHQSKLFIKEGARPVFTTSVQLFSGQTEMLGAMQEELSNQGISATGLTSDLVSMGFEVSGIRFGTDGSIPVWISMVSSAGIELIKTLKRNWHIPENCSFYLVQGPNADSSQVLVLICTDNIIRAMHYIDLNRIHVWEPIALRGDSPLHISMVRTLLLPLLFNSGHHALEEGASIPVRLVSTYPSSAFVNAVNIESRTGKRAIEVRFDLFAVGKAFLEFIIREDQETLFIEGNKRMKYSADNLHSIAKPVIEIDPQLSDVVPYFNRENEIPDPYNVQLMEKAYDKTWEKFSRMFC